MSPLALSRKLSRPAQRSRRKFLEYFPDGFADETYQETERAYKWNAHLQWLEVLGRLEYRSLLNAGEYDEIAARAVRIESRTNLLFSFEKMALRDAVRVGTGARQFAEGLYQWLYGRGSDERRFTQWCETVATLPRRQTRVLTWPLVTVFGFIAEPERHLFLKPRVTQVAAEKYGFPFDYRSRPQWATYESLMSFAAQIRSDQKDLRPKDLIDIQGFIWVLGSDEYED